MRLDILIVVAAILACACERDRPSRPAPAAPVTRPGPPRPEDPAVLEQRRLTDLGTGQKLLGDLDAALIRFEEAHRVASRLEQPPGRLVAGNLDDRATVLLRRGRTGEALALFEQAQAIFRRIAPVDAALAAGVDFRIRLARTLLERGQPCQEPGRRPPEDRAPYLLPTTELHRVLGEANALLATCAKDAPHTLTVKIAVAGDGGVLLAEAQDGVAGTPEGACVEELLRREVRFPPFSGCFVTLTYPFKIGRF